MSPFFDTGAQIFVVSDCPRQEQLRQITIGAFIQYGGH